VGVGPVEIAVVLDMRRMPCNNCFRVSSQLLLYISPLFYFYCRLFLVEGEISGRSGLADSV